MLLILSVLIAISGVIPNIKKSSERPFWELIITSIKGIVFMEKSELNEVKLKKQ